MVVDVGHFDGATEHVDRRVLDTVDDHLSQLLVLGENVVLTRDDVRVESQAIEVEGELDRAILVLVLVRLAIVDVEASRGSVGVVNIDFKTDRVGDARQESQAVIVLQDRNDRATASKHSLVEVREQTRLPLSNNWLALFGVVVVPAGLTWQVEVDFSQVSRGKDKGRLVNFRCNKQGRSKHELSKDLVHVLILRELVPHRSHDGLTILTGLLEGRVDVVNEVVSAVNGVTDSVLNSLRLEPGLSVGEVDVSVSTEERIVHANLVELNVKIIGRLSVEGGNVSTTEDVSGKTILQKHNSGALDLRED